MFVYVGVSGGEPSVSGTAVLDHVAVYASPMAQLLPALVLAALAVLPGVSPKKLAKKSPKGVLSVVLARIPNTVGMILENAVISISLTDYSLIQPMILVSLFVIGLIRREKRSRLNLLGSVLCVLGIAGFRLV